MINILGRHVASALKTLMKGVQTNEELDEDELEDIVSRAANEFAHRKYNLSASS